MAHPTPSGGTLAAYPRRWWTLVVLGISLLVVLGGNSNVNVAVPVIARDLDASSSQLQWLVAAYSLAFAGLLFPAAAISDRFGRRLALEVGLGAFLAATLVAAFINDLTGLIACRAVMGAAAALIMPSALAILVNVFPADERARAIALFSAITGLAGLLGPVVSGWLLTHAWYGVVFLVNVPLIVVALVSGRFLVPSSRDPAQGSFDPVGALLAVLGVSCLIFALIQAPVDGWTSDTTLAAFVVGLIVLTAFVLWELRVDDPMLEMRLFRNSSFSVAAIGTVLSFGAVFGAMFLLTQYLQLVLNYSPFSASLRILPVAPLIVLVSTLTPRLARRFGSNRVMGFGLAFISLGLLLFRGYGVDTAYGYVLLSLLPLVTGVGLIMAPATSAIMSAVPTRRAGSGSAVNEASREFGVAFGVAALGSVAASVFSHDFGRVASAVDRVGEHSAIGSALEAARRLPPALEHSVADAAREAFTLAVGAGATLGAVLAAIGAVIVYRYLPPNDVCDVDGLVVARTSRGKPSPAPRHPQDAGSPT